MTTPFDPHLLQQRLSNRPRRRHRRAGGRRSARDRHRRTRHRRTRRGGSAVEAAPWGASIQGQGKTRWQGGAHEGEGGGCLVKIFPKHMGGGELEGFGGSCFLLCANTIPLSELKSFWKTRNSGNLICAMRSPAKRWTNLCWDHLGSGKMWMFITIRKPTT